MRHTLLAFALLLGTTAPATAQNVGERPWAEKLFTGPLTHDFGSVPRGGKVVYQFPVTNIYSVPLTFTEVRSSCQCLTPKANPVTLQPQQSGVIEVSVDTTKYSGHRVFKVYCTTGPQFISTATLTVTCNARADVVLNPGQFDFGVVAQGKKVIQTVDLEYAGVLDWRITKVTKNPSAPLDVSLEELYRNPPSGRGAGKVGYRVAVTLKENAPAGTLHQDLNLETNDPTAKLVNITVNGTIQASLTASPSAVALGKVKTGETKETKLQIRGNRPFRILGVDGAGDGVTAVYPDLQAANQVITVRYQPTAAGELRKQLTFRTDLDGASVVVTVDGTAAP